MKTFAMFLFFIFQMAFAHSDYTIFLDVKGMPQCLQEKNVGDRALYIIWPKELHQSTRKIFYRVFDQGKSCQELIMNSNKNLLKVNKVIPFTNGHAPKELDVFTLSAYLKLALEQIANGNNRFIPKDALSNSKFLKSIFEPFKMETHKELISDVGEKKTAELYHAYIKAIGLTDNCADLIGKCEYYLCREKQKNCGAKGYFLGFGYQYCSDSLKRLRNEVSPNGKKWLDTTATCLHQQMEEISNNGTCAEIKKAAIRSHDKCYSEVSFCSLKPIEVVKIFDMIKPALFETGVIGEGVQVLEHCAGY